MTESQLNGIYTMITGLESYSHPDNVSETEGMALSDVIECGWTECRLASMSDPVPEDIERCI